MFYPLTAGDPIETRSSTDNISFADSTWTGLRRRWGAWIAVLGIALVLLTGTAAADDFTPSQIFVDRWFNGEDPWYVTEDEINNTEAYAAILASTAIHNPAFVTSLLGTPPVSVAAEFIAFSANIAQKKLPAQFNEPPDDDLVADSLGGCARNFTLPQSEFVFSDLFGFVPISVVTSGGNFFYGVPTDWGDLGTPSVFHQNSEVVIRANHPLIPARQTEQEIYLPAGRHRIDWTAETLFDPVFDLYIPAALLGTSAVAYLKAPQQGAAVAGDAAKATKELSKFKKAMEALAGLDNLTKFKAGLKVGTVTADYLTGTEQIGVTHARTQQINVFDTFVPELTIGTPNLVLEATDFGGVFIERLAGDTFADIVATDECDGVLLPNFSDPENEQRISRPVSLVNDLPRRLPLGNTTVTWTARDAGPNLQFESNSVQATQIITVRDTQAPIMVAPPGKVIEVDPADNDASDGQDSTGVDPAIVDLGTPRVVDLADPSPTVSSDAPAFFPVNSRTEVEWTATDKGFPTPNSSTATQLITVKTLGSNTAPTVSDKSATTLTSQPVEIVLNGIDNDLLDGRVDPLGFEIVDRPDGGEFIAPLYPFFIDDYRTSPSGPYGEDFLLAVPRSKWLYDNICPTALAVDWVYNPQFVHVTDDGIAYIIDSFWKCEASNADLNPRISKWDADGNYIGQKNYGGTTDALVFDQDGFFYTLDKGAFNLTLTQNRPDFENDPNNSNGDVWRFDFNSTPGVFSEESQFSYARVDSQRGIIYLNDRRKIFAFDVRNDLADGENTFRNGMDDYFVGTLNNGDNVFACTSFGSDWAGFAMEVDSQGNLYVADTCGDRIFKFAPSSFDENGDFVAGELIGWMGRCESSTNKACDLETQTSKGYSCTDATCTVPSNARSGEEPGQFDTPIYLSLDPNDTLYIADFGNSRIQRFADDGTFAGEAVSSGTGINQGDRPNFVLGNMGQPKSVSVNSTQFYVVDVEESFVNVFETSPFRDITDSSVTVDYVSKFNFHSDTDVFTYRASDGLDSSNIGTVSVTVNRNFRKPVADDLQLQTDEDTALVFETTGDDPDGIEGVDFNGLDTLSFSIIDQPANGAVTGTGTNRTYTPAPDFFGTDTFTYRAYDGLLNSEPATVTVEILPVDDAPQALTLDLPERAGRGFVVQARGGYFDDGAMTHDAKVDWGNKVDVTGDFVDPDGEGGDPPMLQGVKVLEPFRREGEGAALAAHVYTTTGLKTIEYCMSDELLRETCVTETILIEDLVNLDIQASAAPSEIETGIAEVTIELVNMLPEGAGGLIASDVQILQQPNSLFEVIDIVGTVPECLLESQVLSCDIGDMASGESFSVTISVRSTSPLIYEEDVILQAIATTSSESIYDVYRSFAAIRILVNTDDSDGDGMSDTYEEIYGLNPDSAADAGLDEDGDGLTSLDEFRNRTNPLSVDSDGDTLSDDFELGLGLDPSSSDSDRDGMRDDYELENGLNPLLGDDAVADPDGDGLLNVEEFRKGTDVNKADTDDDTVLDGQDNCPVRPNTDQSDVDGNGTGDVCEIRTVRGDQNGNRRADILFRNGVTGANQLYLMNGPTISQNLAVSPVSPDWEAVGRGDYNGDGKADILWRFIPTGAYWMYLMDGGTVTASLFVGTISDSNWQVVGNGDYDGNGTSDILWRHAVNGTVWLYRMDGNVVTSGYGLGTVPDTDWQIVGSGDYNGDGTADILWRNEATGGNWMYQMSGGLIATSAGVGVTPDLNWKVVGNGDLNGDGKSDILWRNAVTGSNWAFLMDGLSIATSESISVLPDSNWQIVGNDDYSGDDKADVLWRNTANGTNYMYLMDGTTISSGSNISVVTDQNWQIVNTK